MKDELAEFKKNRKIQFNLIKFLN